MWSFWRLFAIIVQVYEYKSMNKDNETQRIAVK